MGFLQGLLRQAVQGKKFMEFSVGGLLMALIRAVRVSAVRVCGAFDSKFSNLTYGLEAPGCGFCFTVRGPRTQDLVVGSLCWKQLGLGPTGLVRLADSGFRHPKR